MLKFSDKHGSHWKLNMVNFVRLDCVKEHQDEYESSSLTLRTAEVKN